MLLVALRQWLICTIGFWIFNDIQFPFHELHQLIVAQCISTYLNMTHVLVLTRFDSFTVSRCHTTLRFTWGAGPMLRSSDCLER